MSKTKTTHQILFEAGEIYTSKKSKDRDNPESKLKGLLHRPELAKYNLTRCVN